MAPDQRLSLGTITSHAPHCALASNFASPPYPQVLVLCLLVPGVTSQQQLAQPFYQTLNAHPPYPQVLVLDLDGREAPVVPTT